jgi:C1A family cysteine protease
VIADAYPSSLDWRTQNAVTTVKNQGQCGSCWAFSTTGAIEGAYAIATGKLVSLSEQQLMGCSGSFGTDGCCGGMMDDAYAYVLKNGGLDTEADYPYTAQDGTCHTAKEQKHVATIFNFTDVTASDAAADQGFQSYVSGVYSGPCTENISHSMLAVGYTPEYWIVKKISGARLGASRATSSCRVKLAGSAAFVAST